MRFQRVLLMLLRLGAAVQLLVGIALWTGHWTQYVNAHRSLGVGYVLVFWAMAITALLRRTNPALATFAIAWGVVIAALGFAQVGILPGEWHWTVRVVHLIVGLSAMPIAERLVKPRTAGAA